jgi:hypothetical protein
MPITQEQPCLSQILFVDVTLRINATNLSAISSAASDLTKTNQFYNKAFSTATAMNGCGIMLNWL